MDMTDLSIVARPIFLSFAHALRFAYACSSRHWDPSVLGRMLQQATRLPDEKGVEGRSVELDRMPGGMDAIAQAGMVRSTVRRVAGDVGEAVMIGRYAPRTFPCSCRRPCCRGRTQNDEMRDAIGLVARELDRWVFTNRSQNFDLRRGYVLLYFGDQTPYQVLADRFGVHVNTVANSAKKVSDWMHGIEDRAGGEISVALQEGGAL